MFKEGLGYIVHSNSFKNEISLGTTQQLKRVVNASQNLALMSMQCKEENNPKHEKEVAFHYNSPIMVNSVPMVKHKHDMGIISFKCSMLIFNLLLIINILFVPTILNEDFVEKGINVLNNVSAVLIVVILSQMYMFQE